MGAKLQSMLSFNSFILIILHFNEICWINVWQTFSCIVSPLHPIKYWAIARLYRERWFKIHLRVHLPKKYLHLYLVLTISLLYIYISFQILDKKALGVLGVFLWYVLQGYITLDVGIYELLFPWQHSTATPVHSFRIGVPTRLERNKFEKKYKIFSEHIVQFDKQYYVFDILLKFIWLIFITRIFTQSVVVGNVLKL